MLSARAHTTLRLLAILAIALAALVPRGDGSRGATVAKATSSSGSADSTHEHRGSGSNPSGPTHAGLGPTLSPSLARR